MGSFDAGRGVTPIMLAENHWPTFSSGIMLFCTLTACSHSTLIALLGTFPTFD